MNKVKVEVATKTGTWQEIVYIEVDGSQGKMQVGVFFDTYRHVVHFQPIEGKFEEVVLNDDRAKEFAAIKGERVAP